MKTIIGQFYKTLTPAIQRAKELKKLWKGKTAFVVIGNKTQGYMVISERQAKECGIKK